MGNTVLLEAISKIFLNILSCIASAEICEIRGKPFPQIAQINAELIFEMASNDIRQIFIKSYQP